MYNMGSDSTGRKKGNLASGKKKGPGLKGKKISGKGRLRTGEISARCYLQRPQRGGGGGGKKKTETIFRILSVGKLLRGERGFPCLFKGGHPAFERGGRKLPCLQIKGRISCPAHKEKGPRRGGEEILIRPRKGGCLTKGTKKVLSRPRGQGNDNHLL